MANQEVLTWLPAVSPVALGQGAGELVHAYLYGDLPEPEREDARRALTLFLDHASPIVRRALAEGVACAENAPHYMVHALANDSSDVAAVVLARSPLLSDAELVDCIATADGFAQSAIARRPWIPSPVCAALAEVAAFEAVLALASNTGADLLEFSIRRIIERHGHDAELRAALLARPNLPVSIRSDLEGAAAMLRAARTTGCTGLPPEKAESLIRDAREQAIVEIAAETASDSQEMVNFVAHLRHSQQLTAGLLLRGLLCGNKNLFEFALCELSGVALKRVVGFVAKGRGTGFAALYRKARMPKRLLPVFIACLEALKKSDFAGPMTARLQVSLIDSVLRASMSVNDGELDHVVAALRRLEAEAARYEAREFQAGAVANARGTWTASRPMPAPPTIAEHTDAIVIDLEAFEAALMAA
jgi:uncharacterized protein (DUF2336 family)